VSLTPSTSGQRCHWHRPTSGQRCHWHCPPQVSGVTSIAHPMVSGVTDIVHWWSAVSLTLPSTGQRCHQHRPPVVSGDTEDYWSAVSLALLTTKKTISKSNISANSKPYSERILPVDQWRRESSLMKNSEIENFVTGSLKIFKPSLFFILHFKIITFIERYFISWFLSCICLWVKIFPKYIIFFLFLLCIKRCGLSG
jgi:hypothetical protein